MPPTVVPLGMTKPASLAIPWFDPVTQPGKVLAPYCSEFSRLHGHTKRKGFWVQDWKCWKGPWDHLAQSLRLATDIISKDLGLGGGSLYWFQHQQLPLGPADAPSQSKWHGEMRGWVWTSGADCTELDFWMVIFPRDHQEIQVTHCPVPHTTQIMPPLRFPTCFNRNQNILQETKLGIVYDFLFLTWKHLTKF